MDHRDRYLQLLSRDLRGSLLEAIERQGYFGALKVKQASVVDAEPVPYLLLQVEADPRFTAIGGGLYLDLMGVVSDPPAERYYLPYVGLTPNAGQGDLEHELEHLRDHLELMVTEPSYASDAERVGLSNIEDPALIPDSTRFEVRKLFLLEAPVFGREFDRGKCAIDFPMVFGMSWPFRCESREEYVALWMASYVGGLRGFYLERFPQHASQIEAGLARATDEYGMNVFGPHPFESMTSSWNELPKRVVAQMLESMNAQ